LPKIGRGRPETVFALDVIISVGYRVKSIRGTRFRQWATRVLREMLLNRMEELKRIDGLERRMVAVEGNVEQMREGIDYLAQQLESEPETPRPRIGFGAKEGELVQAPYGTVKRP